MLHVWFQKFLLTVSAQKKSFENKRKSKSSFGKNRWNGVFPPQTVDFFDFTHNISFHFLPSLNFTKSPTHPDSLFQHPLPGVRGTPYKQIGNVFPQNLAQGWRHTDGSEILLTNQLIERLSHHLQGFWFIPGGFLAGFLNHQQYHDIEFHQQKTWDWRSVTTPLLNKPGRFDMEIFPGHRILKSWRRIPATWNRWHNFKHTLTMVGKRIVVYFGMIEGERFFVPPHVKNPCMPHVWAVLVWHLSG